MKTDIKINILDFIPWGHQNAISRQQLSLRTGLRDRINRALIEQERKKGHCIISLKRGGYFRPLQNDDRPYVMEWYLRECSRAKSIDEGVKSAVSFLNQF